jgi:Protein of unknown function (DUF2800)
VLGFDKDRHLYTWKGEPKPSVTQILAADGICDYSFVRMEDRLAAMERGKTVHWMLQLDDEGLLQNRVSSELQGYRSAWREAKKNLGIKVLKVEPSFYCEQYDYCGTPDRVVVADDKLAIVDFKTGSVLPWAAIQMASYVMGVFLKGWLWGTPELVRRIGLQLNADGSYRKKEFGYQDFCRDWAKFLRARENTRETWQSKIQQNLNSDSKAFQS